MTTKLTANTGKGTKPAKIGTPAKAIPASTRASGQSKSPTGSGKTVAGFAGAVKSGKV